jgi:LysM repeat protein
VGGLGLVMRRSLLRIVAPAAFLGTVTILVLVVHAAMHRSTHMLPTPTSAKRAVVSFTQRPVRAYYRLQPGDTLDTVASRFRTTAYELLLFNPGIAPQGLAPGQKIRVR